jgi:hypothetical protein
MSSKKWAIPSDNALKVLILGGSVDALWSTALIPTTPVEISPPLVPPADAIDQALRDRPEMAQGRISAEINQRDTRYYRELTKPQIDLIATRSKRRIGGRAGASGSQSVRIRRAAIRQRTAPISRRHLDAVSGAAAPDRHDQHPQHGAPRGSRPERSHRVV